MAEKRQKKIGNKKRELNNIWIKSKETVEGFYLAIPEIFESDPWNVWKSHKKPGDRLTKWLIPNGSCERNIKGNKGTVGAWLHMSASRKKYVSTDNAIVNGQNNIFGRP